MKKILSALLVIGLVFTGSSVSAFGGEGNSKMGQDKEQILEQRAANQAEREAKQAERVERQEQRSEALGGLFTEYNPEGLPTFNSLSEERNELHDQTQASNDQFRTSVRSEQDNLKAQYENGEISEDEYRELLSLIRTDMTVYREQVKELREAKKEEVSTLREESKAAHQEIATIQSSDNVDGERISDLLDEINAISAQNLEIHYKYSELLNTLRSSY